MKHKGFILLEAMLALVILSVVLVACIQSISSFVRAMRSSYNMKSILSSPMEKTVRRAKE